MPFFCCPLCDTSLSLGAGLTVSAASTYSPDNIRVNLVVPGLVGSCCYLALPQSLHLHSLQKPYSAALCLA